MNRTILLIDEEEDVANAFATRLRDAGFAVTPAYSVKEALAILAKQQAAFDVLVIDVMMPADKYGSRMTTEGIKTGIFYDEIAKSYLKHVWQGRFFILTNVASAAVWEVIDHLKAPSGSLKVLQKAKYAPELSRNIFCRNWEATRRKLAFDKLLTE
jgi:CheY-like chemotaxis protein